MKRLIPILMFSLVSFATTVRGINIEVLQGGTSLGTFQPYTGSLSAVDNYNYFSSAAHITFGPGHVAGEEQIFFYKDGSGNLSFNTVFRQGSGGQSYMDWSIAVDSAGDQTVLVSDDSNELSETAGGPGSTENFTGDWTWLNHLTDGGVIGHLAGNWKIRINPTFFDGSVGSEDIQVYDVSGSTIGLAKNTTQEIVFRAASVPNAASTAALFGLGLLAVLSASRGRGLSL